MRSLIFSRLGWKGLGVPQRNDDSVSESSHFGLVGRKEDKLLSPTHFLTSRSQSLDFCLQRHELDTRINFMLSNIHSFLQAAGAQGKFWGTLKIVPFPSFPRASVTEPQMISAPTHPLFTQITDLNRNSSTGEILYDLEAFLIHTQYTSNPTGLKVQ